MVVTARRTRNLVWKTVFSVMCVLIKEKYLSCLKSLRVLWWDRELVNFLKKWEAR